MSDPLDCVRSRKSRQRNTDRKMHALTYRDAEHIALERRHSGLDVPEM